VEADGFAMEPQLTPAAKALIYASCVASFSTLLILAQRYFKGRPILQYEPRHRVPWGVGVAILAMVIPVMTVVASIVPIESSEEVTDTSFVYNALTMCSVSIAFVLAVGFFLYAVSHANTHDLGFPNSFRQFLGDIRLGVVGCAASLLPVYVVHFILFKLIDPQEDHPLIEDLQHSPTTGMLLAGLVTVAVAAPLFEEFVFRLLLQGWLEKWEDEQVGYAGLQPPSPVSLTQSEELSIVDEPADATEQPEVIDWGVDESLPQRGVLTDLPHGWLPILISSTLFGLVHLGNGVSPVPLVLFGLVLGYLYQRTHRLVPSMTAHALFNSYSMAMLWLSV
jgi:membrane protease YdiL (CAAX protease family)